MLKMNKIVAVCSSRNAEFCKSIGATHVVDYTSQDVVKELQTLGPFDEIYDCIGGTEVLDHYEELLRSKSSSYITIVGDKTSR